MNLPMLAVDSDNEFSRREQAAWLAQGIATVRVGSMQEAIEKLNKEDFLFDYRKIRTIIGFGRNKQ